jgi:hypothetical protein
MAGALVIEHMSKTMDEFVVRFAGFQVHKTERTSRTAEPSEFQCEQMEAEFASPFQILSCERSLKADIHSLQNVARRDRNLLKYKQSNARDQVD